MNKIAIVFGVLTATALGFVPPQGAISRQMASQEAMVTRRLTAIARDSLTEVNYTGTNEDGDQEDIDTGKQQGSGS
ncbi:MAG TPA: hypothetical protein IGS52_07330 [Oscillatoriaceae cyanobacterium M33_DOE_052]|uniref:Uncharacterized protein n=1 Tax=Planktothricoides sp. SpSt-374 TaxID=2282167 RepID=A0A7C3VQQ6_9CYAN|nr:hypothetical protein [Oscillatoriaceae cyanobacterium M33_DOE_052]